jgi:hypothetical protein
MANDLAHHEPQGGALAPAGESANLLAQIVAAAANPEVDAGKMQAMAGLAMQLQDREHEQQFNRDFNAAVMAMPIITKTGRILIPGKNGEADRVQGSYARFEDLNRIVKPILRENNLSITFEIGGDRERITVAPILTHRNGTTRKWPALPLPLETSGSKNNVQGVGSSVSYGKRYAMCAALNISVEAEDDDASGGKVTMPEERANLVIEEATAAYDDGRYQEWFRAQSPKDRAYLITSGKHAEFGGAAPLAITVQGNDPATARKSGAQAAGEIREELGKRMTLADRVTQYESDVASCHTLEALQELQLERAPWIEQVRGRRPDLAERITAANSQRYAQLSGNRDDSAERSQDDSNGPASNLFGDDA